KVDVPGPDAEQDHGSEDGQDGRHGNDAFATCERSACVSRVAEAGVDPPDGGGEQADRHRDGRDISDSLFRVPRGVSLTERVQDENPEPQDGKRRDRYDKGEGEAARTTRVTEEKAVRAVGFGGRRRRARRTRARSVRPWRVSTRPRRGPGRCSRRGFA